MTVTILVICVLLLCGGVLILVMNMASFITRLAEVVLEIRQQVNDLHEDTFAPNEMEPPADDGLVDVETPQVTYDPRFTAPITSENP